MLWPRIIRFRARRIVQQLNEMLRELSSTGTNHDLEDESFSLKVDRIRDKFSQVVYFIAFVQ